METPYPQSWMDRVGKFAEAVGIEIEKINEAFEPMVGKPSDEAVVILGDANAVSDAEIKDALKSLGIPTGKLNIHLAKLRPEKVIEEAAPAEKTSTSSMSLSILPTVPSDDSFLESLKTGGVLKIGETEVLAAIKAALAQKVGLFQLPEKILEKMENFALAQEEPCGEEFYAMQKLVTEKKYGDVLSAINVSGSYISESRKKAFFERLNIKLWPALNDFQNRLVAWRQAWMQGMADPGAWFMTMAAAKSGNIMPPGMMSPPDTADLQAAAEEVINEINRVFAGPGIPVARALAYDATRIMKILENKNLPTQTGAANKDQMIKDLGISVGSEIVRVEQSLTRYALAIMSLEKVTPGDDELIYFSAMFQLGTTIPWDKLTTKGLSGRDLR
jgi:hypothetical protein